MWVCFYVPTGGCWYSTDREQGGLCSPDHSWGFQGGGPSSLYMVRTSRHFVLKNWTSNCETSIQGHFFQLVIVLVRNDHKSNLNAQFMSSPVVCFRLFKSVLLLRNVKLKNINLLPRYNNMYQYLIMCVLPTCITCSKIQRPVFFVLSSHLYVRAHAHSSKLAALKHTS